MTTPTTEAGRALLAECIEHQGTRDRKGYGVMSVVNEHGGWSTVRAHRWTWQTHFGPIPEGMVVMHRCDNPPCINPEHLAIGTHADNIRDRDAKGRTATGDRNGSRTRPDRRPYGDPLRNPQPGEENGNAKLTEFDVETIRRRAAAGETGKAIALDYEIHPTTAQRIISGRRWRHVPTL